MTITRKEKVVYNKSFGHRDISANKKMESDAIFRIYSMTKAITSAAALVLVDDGKLALDPAKKDRLAMVYLSDKGARSPIADMMTRATGRRPGCHGEAQRRRACHGEAQRRRACHGEAQRRR